MIRLHDIFDDSSEEKQASGHEFAFYCSVQFAFAGIILFYIFFQIAARYASFSDFPPVWQLFMGQLPFVVGGTGGALLGLRKSLKEHGWRKVLDMPAALPCKNDIFYRKLVECTLFLVSGSILLTAIAMIVLKAAGFHNFPRQILEIYGSDAGFPFWFAAFISAIVIAPVTEEILFRRVLYQGLKSLNFSRAGLVAAVLFSLCHGLPQAFLSYVFFSLILQKACHKGSLWMAIALHAGFNLVMFAMLIGKILFFSA